MAEEEDDEEEKRCAVANLIPSSWLETTANKARLVKISTAPSLPEKADDDDEEDAAAAARGETTATTSTTATDPALMFSLRSYASHSEIRNNERTRDWMYALTETNMRKMYEQTWGWNSLEKRRELNHQNAKFVFAVEKKKKKKCDDGSTKSEEEEDEEDEELPVAFAHFRFEVDDDDVASVYIYELQVERTKKRLGLGRLLMRACEKIAVELGLKHMALTVLKKNEGARAFYEKIGYEETDHAPADAHYVIMRKRV